MKKHIKTFDNFEIVVVPFPFIETSKSKKRPALILSSSLHFNRKAGASVLAMITSAMHNSWPLDIPITRWEDAGLPVPSLIRMKLFTLDHRLILKKIGILHKTDQAFVIKALKTLFF
ncbi:MAG: type II toxin-antitoxin system PemK/MazF family toxin [Chlamydiia bacterium]|nr:type II toxin-antitoxin system PemK/MazF family toxin [Chlamydiia bacterium]